MRVKVHYNLHKKCLSVISLEKERYGRVIDHVESISLKDAKFKVSAKGRQRVLREQQKNVHAHVVGFWVSVWIPRGTVWRATYNPYKYNSFVNTITFNPVHEAKQVHINKRSIFYVR
tara:strand:+ start:108 stop:458 length:351 start_codon:yes stop_codon:yes gene_type:complete